MKEEALSLPDAIYFDTNALKQLHAGSSNIDFLEIQDNARRIKAEIIVPEIVVQEWITLKIEEVYSELERIKTATSNVNRILGTGSLNLGRPGNIEGSIRQQIMNFTNSAGIKIVPAPKTIEFDTLTKMAISHEAPFEKGDKGFKDTLILFTIQDYSLRNNHKNVILISRDHIFSDYQLKKRLTDKGLQLVVVTDISGAKKCLEKRMKDFITASIESQSQKMKSFLEGKFEYIAEYVIENAEVSKDFVKGTFLRIFDPEQSEVKGTIKQVTAVRPKGISFVFPGIVGRKKPKEAGSEYVTFDVDIDLDIVVERSGSGPFNRNKPKFPLSDPTIYEIIPEGLRESHEEQETVMRKVTLEAEILVVDNTYQDLKLLNIYAY